MRFVDEFQDPALAQRLIEGIREAAKDRVNLMEVCGTHTMALFRYGLRPMLPEQVRVLSGPGCPVCVTPTGVVDAAIAVSRLPGIILTTFGDMVRVPGSSSSLEREKAEGAEIRVVYSSLDALRIAEANPGREVALLAVGFETTSPSIACALLEADERGMKNFSIIPANKLIPPAMKALLESGETKIQGFICPGHVSTVIGSKPYDFIPREYGVPCIISGFEPIDILQSIYMILRQIRKGAAKVEIQYSRCVRPEGNPKAKSLLYTVFEPCNSDWRGLGEIPLSGLRLSEKYVAYDALQALGLRVEQAEEPRGCRCGEVLRGVVNPHECPLFGGACTPERPIGPCMVSSEGTCAAYYRYDRRPSGP